jgi:hypothetical protein
MGSAVFAGAKAAKPDAQVICLHGDGSFGQNAMELDTAERHKLPLLCVISLARLGQPDGISPSRMAEMLEVDKAGLIVRC